MSTVTVQLDEYPCSVTFPSGASINKARVTIADRIVRVYVIQNGTPDLYYERPVESTEGRFAKKGIDIVVEGGGQMTVRQVGGCGCGDVLKRWNPWPGQVRARAAL